MLSGLIFESMMVKSSLKLDKLGFQPSEQGKQEEEEEEEEEEEPSLIYTAQGSPVRRKKLSVINGSPEQQRTKEQGRQEL